MALLIALLLASGPGASLTPEQLAAVAVEQEQALAPFVRQAQRGRLSSAQRSALIRAEEAAALAVLAKHGLTAKAYHRRLATLRPEERAAFEAAAAALRAQPPGEAGRELPVADNSKELVLDPDRAGWPTIEEGVPVEDLPTPDGGIPLKLKRR